MKKWVVYLLGILTGVVLTMAGISLFAYINNAQSDDGITYFEKPGKIAEDKAFKVFQVIYDDAALVNAQSDEDDDLYFGKVYLLVNDEGEYYYDEQKITAPAGKVFRQVGICRYPTKNDNIKTVPVIMLMDK
jgi:hypothetical protein